MLNLTKRQLEIIEVSIGLIAASGIQNLTIKNLSEKIGISEPAIYRHYKSKLDILAGILDYFEYSSKALLDKAYNSNKSNIEKISDIFILKCEEFSNKPELAKVIFSEEIFQNEAILADKVKSTMKMHQEVISKIITEGQNKGEIRTDIPTEHLSHIVMGSLRLLVTRWRMTNFEFNIVERALLQCESIKKIIVKK